MRARQRGAEVVLDVGSPRDPDPVVWDAAHHLVLSIEYAAWKTGRSDPEGAAERLWRDDLDTAFRHLELYDRFGCPGNHVQATFRCVVVQGNIDPKAIETLNSRVHECWLNPESFAAAAAEPPTPAAPATQ